MRHMPHASTGSISKKRAGVGNICRRGGAGLPWPEVQRALVVIRATLVMVGTRGSTGPPLTRGPDGTRRGPGLFHRVRPQACSRRVLLFWAGDLV
jgi:hypothetical protein